jgi:hypothetical protein
MNMAALRRLARRIASAGLLDQDAGALRTGIR